MTIRILDDASLRDLNTFGVQAQTRRLILIEDVAELPTLIDKNLIDASYFTFIAARRSAIDADFIDFLIAQGGNVFSTYRTTDNNGTRRIHLLHLCAKHLNAPLYHYLISRGVTPLSVTSTDTHVLEFTFHSPELLPTVMTSLPLFDTEEKCIKYIDDEGNIKSDSYKKFMKDCVDRTDGWGEVGEENGNYDDTTNHL